MYVVRKEGMWKERRVNLLAYQVVVRHGWQLLQRVETSAAALKLLPVHVVRVWMVE